MSRASAAGVALLCLAASPAAAAVVVIGNTTPDAVAFTVRHANGATAVVELAPGRSKAVHSAKTVDVAFTTAGKPTELRLEAYSAYVFTARKGVVELRGIELAGRPVPAADIPDAVTTPELFPVAVKLAVGESERRTRKLWEPILRRRFEQAAEVFAADAGVKLELAAVEEWGGDANAADLRGLLADFAKTVKPDPARVAVGYTNRTFIPDGEKPDPKAPTPFGHVRGIGYPHLIVRDGVPRAEAERVEVLVHFLGRYFGAAPSPDGSSAMRLKLGDGRAISARFRVGFDPLNVLAMHMWVEQMRAGKATPAALPAAAAARLGRVYGTLAAALPDETFPGEMLTLMTKAGIVDDPAPEVAVAPKAGEKVFPPEGPRPAAKKPDRPLSPREEVARKVVRAVTLAAADNAGPGGRRADGATRVKGDDLTSLYIRTAADVAATEERDARAAGFLLGLGIALDDSDILRKNPLSAAACTAVESDDERKARLLVLGLPTVKNRRDLCQHFAVSAALTELVGPALAEQAGLMKELVDMSRPSGFSFTDLAADFSGVAFGRLVKQSPDAIETYRKAFGVGDFVPKIDGLRDGISKERFKQDFGDTSDDRFKAAVDAVRKRVKDLPAFEKLEK